MDVEEHIEVLLIKKKSKQILHFIRKQSSFIINYKYGINKEKCFICFVHL